MEGFSPNPAGEVVQLERRAAVAWVTISRAEKRNALSRGVLEALGETFEHLQSDSELRAVVLTGAGEKAFAAGADIGELATLDPLQARALSHATDRLFLTLERFPVPVIAAINGYALGGGLELAMACPLRLAAEHAQLGQPEVKLGLIPGYGGTQRLPRLIGTQAALAMILTGEPISAGEALRLGLVLQVVPGAELKSAAATLAARIAAQAPLAVQFALQAVRAASASSLEEGLELESSLFALCCATQDMKEGTRAFLDKRAPEFRGR